MQATNRVHKMQTIGIATLILGAVFYFVAIKGYSDLLAIGGLIGNAVASILGFLFLLSAWKRSIVLKLVVAILLYIPYFYLLSLAMFPLSDVAL